MIFLLKERRIGQIFTASMAFSGGAWMIL